jgi:hypothetical protein
MRLLRRTLRTASMDLLPPAVVDVQRPAAPIGGVAGALLCTARARRMWQVPAALPV